MSAKMENTTHNEKNNQVIEIDHEKILMIKFIDKDIKIQ